MSKAKEEVLWCEVCQHGINGFPNKDNYSEGDVCPMCLDRDRMRADKLQRAGTLKTVDQVVKEKAERAEFIKKEKERNKIRHIEGADEKIRRTEEKLRNENKDLRQRVEQMEKFFASQQEKGKLKEEVKTSTKTK